MKEIILIKNGEIALKGQNRSSFEAILIKNAKRRLKSLGNFRFSKAQSTIYAEPLEEDIDLDEAVRRLGKVFGIVGLSRACVVEKDYEDIREKSAPYLREVLEGARTFKVEAKRSDKSFPMKSPEICRELGGHLLEQFPHLRVDVVRPDVVVYVEIRDFAAYLHAGQLAGAGGLPVGSSGRGALLISGGIDSRSPVHDG
ncbi:MAG: THUMP domain-containing protein [Oscillospiraceae bacterium]